jgi:hypothetical protein
VCETVEERRRKEERESHYGTKKYVL